MMIRPITMAQVEAEIVRWSDGRITRYRAAAQSTVRRMTDDLDLAFSLLPLDLRPLAPLIPRYAEGDDVIRSQILAGASTTDLQDLVSAAAPHWSAINAFLDSNLDPPGPSQDLALALDSFSQAAMEAAFELDRRGSQ